MSISSVNRLVCKLIIVLEEMPTVEIPTHAQFGYLDGEDDQKIKIGKISAVRVDGKLLNFGEHKLSLTAEVDDKKYMLKSTTIDLHKDASETYYYSGEILKLVNQRGAFRTQAFFKAVLTNNNTHAVTDVRVYDISSTGIGILIDEGSGLSEGTPVTVSIITDKSSLSLRSECIKVFGEIVRRADCDFPGKHLIGIKLDEKGKPALYDKLVNMEQIRYRNGRSNAK